MSRYIVRIAVIVDRADEPLSSSAPMMFTIEGTKTSCDEIARALHDQIQPMANTLMESFAKRG
jgi:hypothetical protein